MPMARTLKTQPRLCITQVSAAPEMSKTCCGASTPQATKPMITAPTTPTMTLSIP